MNPSTYYSGVTNFVNYISATCMSHVAVQSFGTGEFDDRDVDGDFTYPRVFLEQPFINKRILQNQSIWNLTLVIVDLEKDDRSDEMDKLHSTKVISDQLIQKFNQDKQLVISGEINFLSVKEYDDSITAGWRVEFPITMAVPVYTCDNTIFQ